MRGSIPHTRSTSTGANRSDQIRKRRSSPGAEHASGAARRAAAPARPVVVRGSGSGAGGYATRSGPAYNSRSASRPLTTPIYRQNATSHPRRQFYVAMENGAELRLPAITLVNPGWRVLSALLVILALFGIFSMMNSDFFRILKVDYRGFERVTPQEMDTILHLQNLSIVEIEPAVLTEQITRAFPELADVQVSMEMPNYVTVSARERQPVLAWQQGEKTLWIDPEGHIFPKKGDIGALVTVNTDDALPLAPLEQIQSQPEDLASMVTQEDAAATQTKANADPAAALTNRLADLRLLNATLQLAKKLPEGTQVIYSKANGLGWSDPGGWQVYIGKDLNDFDVKFAVYQTILQNLLDQGVTPELISVEHPNAPFYRAAEEKQPEE